MRYWTKAVTQLSGICGLAIGLALLTGCQTSAPTYSEIPGTEPKPAETPGKVNVFHVGDMVEVIYSAPASDKVFQPHQERVKEDGTITPPDVGSIVAKGKTAGALQKELQERYDRLYRHLTVTVRPGERFFYVDGEVTRRGAQQYLGETDIVNAIAAAGGFTDYAKKSSVRLIHPNGKTEVIDYNKAIEQPELNVPVYPGDKVFVPRRFF